MTQPAVTSPAGPAQPVVPFPPSLVGTLLPSGQLFPEPTLYPGPLMHAGLYAELDEMSEFYRAIAGAAEVFPVAESPEVYA